MPTAPTRVGIFPADLAPVEEGLARRLLVRARSIAPGIRTVQPESEEKKDAIAILKAVAKRATDIGSGTVASKSRNGTSISLRDIRSAFSLDDINGLRDIFAALDAPPAGLPRGSFPLGRPLAKLWPEGPYS